MDSLLHDVRYALRTLGRAPGFTAVATLTLALGIGANTAIFSVVSGVLLRPLPYAQPERLAAAGYLMNGEYLLAREHSRAFDELALYRPELGFNLAVAGEPDRVGGARASANLFSTLGVAPLHGRSFLPAEEMPGENRVVLLSHALWRQRFAGDPATVGREILVDSEPHTVVGVMPPGFGFPGDARLWVPIAFEAVDPVDLWGGAGGQTVGRLAVGSTAARAQSELRALAGAMRAANTLWTPPPEYGTEREVVPLREQIVGDARGRLLIALGAVALVLLIACANVANLMLARGAVRKRELAIRTALGAGRGRLLRQLLTESGVLAGLGGALGLAVAFGGVRLLRAGLPAETPRLAEIGIDARVLLFVAAVTLLATLLFGLLPAVRAARTDVEDALKQGGRSDVGVGHRRLAGGLVVAELALALMLVIGAGLLLRSFWSLLRVEPGFRVESLVSARITPPAVRYGTAARQREFYAALLEQVGALPGVTGVALVDALPLEPWAGGVAFEVEGQPYLPGTSAPVVRSRALTPEYPRLMGIPLLRGRALNASDRAGAEQVALINEAMARRHWPGEDAVGKRFKPVWWQDEWITVVGILADTRQHGLTGDVEPEMYRPYAQAPSRDMTAVVRADAPPDAVAAGLRAALAAVDAEVPVSEVQALRETLSRAVATPRFTTVLLGVFGLVALVLGAIGIYAVIAYSTSRRTQELGVRMALGARPVDVLRLVLRQGAGLTVIGIGIGLLGALAATRLLRGLLYGVEPVDPITFGVVAMLLAATALLASYLPARRATRVDPVVALRHD